MKEIKNLASGVEERLPFGRTMALAVQHMLLAILAAFPPALVIGSMAGLSGSEMVVIINAFIFTTGVTTILGCTGILGKWSPKIPVVLGSAVAFIGISGMTIKNAPSHSIGFQLVAGGTIAAGILCFLLAPIWSKLQRFFPPLIVGIAIMVIGISLLPTAFSWILKGSKNNVVEPKSFYLAAFVFLLHVILSKYLKGILGNLTVLFSIIIGTIVSAFMGMMDFSQLKDTPWFALNLPFHFGAPRFDVSVTGAFLVIIILMMVEVTGSSIGLHKIADKEMDEKQLTKMMRTTGISAVLSGGFNGIPQTVFVQNMGLLDLTKVHSRFPVAAAGILMVIVSCFPKFAALIGMIPLPVLGGIGFALFGIVISSGIKMLKEVPLEGNYNGLIIALSIGMALLPSVHPDFYQRFPSMVQNILGNGLVAGNLTAIILNIFFNFKELFMQKK